MSRRDKVRADGSLRPAEMARKKQAIINLVKFIPDDLSRTNSDTMEVVARLLANVHRRAMDDKKGRWRDLPAHLRQADECANIPPDPVEPG